MPGNGRSPFDCGSLLPLSAMQPCCEPDGIGTWWCDLYQSSRGQQAVSQKAASGSYRIGAVSLFRHFPPKSPLLRQRLAFRFRKEGQNQQSQ